MSTAPTITPQRQKQGQLIRPNGPKPVSLGNTCNFATGGSLLVSQAVDLSLPIRGIRIVSKGRVVVGTAAFSSTNPEGLLNLISNITIQGTNARQKGNVTLWNCDMATCWVYGYLFGPKGSAWATIATAGAGSDAEVPPPGTPFPAPGTAVPNRSAGYFNGATGTYDWVITMDLPFHPMTANALGKQPLQMCAFLVRNEEWKDSLQLQFTFGAQAGAGATGVLGVSAGTTTVTFSAYNSGTGSPTLDIYSLPVMMGLSQKDTILPGILSRTTQPINTVLQSAGTNVVLLNMQKQPTPRVLFKVGTGTVSPAFATLSDTNVSTLGISLGGNRNVRNNVDIKTWKHAQADDYATSPVQGYVLMDFMSQGNPDSSFDGQNIGDGATFQLVGTVAGVANGFGLTLQEQILHTPTGSLLAS
jgi:hypothetical protein